MDITRGIGTIRAEVSPLFFEQRPQFYSAVEGFGTGRRIQIASDIPAH